MDQEKIFLIIRTIFNRYDPIGIIFDDDNPDEYDFEVNKIIAILNKSVSQKKLSEEIYKIFIECFDEKIAGDKKKYDKIASEILKFIK